jgi:hypothetical protein
VGLVGTVFLALSGCRVSEMVLFTKAAEHALVSMRFMSTTFSDGCLGSNNDEGRSEV